MRRYKIIEDRVFFIMEDFEAQLDYSVEKITDDLHARLRSLRCLTVTGALGIFNCQRLGPLPPIPARSAACIYPNSIPLTPGKARWPAYANSGGSLLSYPATFEGRGRFRRHYWCGSNFS